MFGVPLSLAVQRSVIVDGIELPTVFRECIDFLEERGKMSVPLYFLLTCLWLEIEAATLISLNHQPYTVVSSVHCIHWGCQYMCMYVHKLARHVHASHACFYTCVRVGLVYHELMACPLPCSIMEL